MRWVLSGRGRCALAHHSSAPETVSCPAWQPRSQKQRPEGDDGGVADALRAAIERTLAATAPAAGQTRERAGEIVGEISKRGQDARDELARRARRPAPRSRGWDRRLAMPSRGGALEATGELRSQLDALEKRLASVEDRLKAAQTPVARGSRPEGRRI